MKLCVYGTDYAFSFKNDNYSIIQIILKKLNCRPRKSCVQMAARGSASQVQSARCVTVPHWSRRSSQQRVAA